MTCVKNHYNRWVSQIGSWVVPYLYRVILVHGLVKDLTVRLVLYHVGHRLIEPEKQSCYMINEGHRSHPYKVSLYKWRPSHTYFLFSQLNSIIDPYKRKSLNTILGSLGKNLVYYSPLNTRIILAVTLTVSSVVLRKSRCGNRPSFPGHTEIQRGSLFYINWKRKGVGSFKAEQQTEERQMGTLNQKCHISRYLASKS